MFQLVQLPPSPRIVVHNMSRNRYFSTDDGYEFAITRLRTRGWQLDKHDPTPVIISSPFSDYNDLTQKHPELLI